MQWLCGVRVCLVCLVYDLDGILKVGEDLRVLIIRR